ncbi:MAG: hypothetical protein GXX96_17625 [Planctomycetaceae bacterium]|nr:hypothetical protein [Planctomycetaceae bacterium]
MLKLASLFLPVAVACSGAAAEELLPMEHVVVFNNNGRVPPSPNVYPLFRLSERFGLVEDFYTSSSLDVSLPGNLTRSRMLYVGQYCDELPLFRDPAIGEAVREHLKQGGILVFDYNTGTPQGRFHPETDKFLKSVGVESPGVFQTGYGSSRLAEAGSHAIVSQPVAVGGKGVGHYGWWEKWSPDQVVLARDQAKPGQATLILQEGVLGKGAVLFSQLPTVFRSDDGLAFDLVHNIIAYAYGDRRK